MCLRFKIIKIAIVFASIVLASGTIYADYSFTRYPLEKVAKVTATFGQFREYTKQIDGTKKITYVGGHEGIDLDDEDNAPIYSVAAGEVFELRKRSPGYGNVLIIKHTNSVPNYQSFYAHMSSIPYEDKINTRLIEGVPYNVNTTDPIGYVGSTGGGASTGSHLHFQVGNPAIRGGEENPLAAGLNQPYVNYMQTTIEAYSDALFPGNAYIRLLGPGDDGKFDRLNYVKSGDIYNKIEDPEENEELNYPKAGEPIKIVVEAYQNSLFNGFRTAPYGVEFNITEIGGSYNKSQVVRFNKTLSEINGKIDEYYCFTKPFITKPFSGAAYYYMDWTPGEGVYKIQAKVYAAYREGGVLKFQTPIIKERIVSIGLAGIDYDSPYGYAFAQYDPNTGLPGLASSGGVHAAGVGDDEPTIYYTDVSAPRFSMSPGDTTYPKNTVISARADKNVNWTVKIFDESGGTAATLTGTGDRLSKKWAGAGNGKYTYQVEAQDAVSGEKAERDGIGIIIVDNQPPDIKLKSDSTINITTSDAKAVVEFTANEDLALARVDIVDIAGVSIAEYFKVQPHLKKDELFQADWVNPWANANGWYYLKIMAFDLAGNRTVKYVPVRVDLPGGVSPTTTAPTEPIKRTNPPEEVKNIAVGDIDFDDNGNSYVLYTKQMKLVKYDGSGKEIGKIEKFGADSQDYFWYPQGLAVSPSGDRVYVADTYSDRLLIFDGGLNLIKAVQGRDVFLEYTRDEIDNYFFFIKTGHTTNHYRYEMLGEGYDQPKDVYFAGGNMYVADSGRHRILKYDLNGDEVVFDKLEGKHGPDDNCCYHYTNSLNETKDSSGHRADRIGYSAFNAMDGAPHPNVMIHEISSTGNGAGGGELTAPEVAFAQASGSVYVADTGNNRVQVFNADGSYRFKFGEGTLVSPQGIDVDGLGNIYVADTGNHRIVKFSSAGDFIREYRSEDGEITPLKIKLKGGKLYIADANSSRPLVWEIGGEIKDFGCSAKISPNGDGNGDSALIGYELTESGRVTLRLLNSAKEEIGQLFTYTASRPSYALVSDSLREKGVHNEFWSGYVQPSLADEETSGNIAAVSS
jgi:murein DD-endopeptidase MepM/ murein hydrolase activator NlpD/DNA-binding beta-propeller fold protein YncE